MDGSAPGRPATSILPTSRSLRASKRLTAQRLRDYLRDNPVVSLGAVTRFTRTRNLSARSGPLIAEQHPATIRSTKRRLSGELSDQQAGGDLHPQIPGLQGRAAYLARDAARRLHPLA